VRVSSTSIQSKVSFSLKQNRPRCSGPRVLRLVLQIDRYRRRNRRGHRVADLDVGGEIACGFEPGPVPILRPLETPLTETSRAPPLVVDDAERATVPGYRAPHGVVRPEAILVVLKAPPPRTF